METVEDNILPLTHQDIADISDPGEAICIGIEHDIPLDELITLEEMKQRLMCHFRLQDQGSYKSKVLFHTG